MLELLTKLELLAVIELELELNAADELLGIGARLEEAVLLIEVTLLDVVSGVGEPSHAVSASAQHVKASGILNSFSKFNVFMLNLIVFDAF